MTYEIKYRNNISSDAYILLYSEVVKNSLWAIQ